MNILAIVGRFRPYCYPTAKHTKRVLDGFVELGHNITILSFGPSSGVFKENNFSIIELKDYFLTKQKTLFGSLIKFIYKIISKLCSLFSFSFRFESFLLHKKIINTNVKKYDCVISFSGLFSAHDEAIRLAKRMNKPVFLCYTDPFSPIYKNKHKYKHAIHLESKWLRLAKHIFMPSNYYNDYCLTFPWAKQKISTSELAGCFSAHELNIIDGVPINKNTVVYAGMFNNTFRKPDSFIEIATNNPNYTFYIYDNNFLKIYKSDLPTNVVVCDRVSGEEYLKVIGSAFILYLEDNEKSVQIPFKAFEYLSSRRNILFVTNNRESNTSKLLYGFTNVLVVDKDKVNQIVLNNTYFKNVIIKKPYISLGCYDGKKIAINVFEIIKSYI